MKMKRHFLILPAILVLSGCVGTMDLGVLDPSIPEDMQCPLKIEDVTVIVYDNQPVEWSRDSVTQNKVTIVLPPGQHSFIVKWYSSSSNQNVTTTSTNTAKIEHEFIPGHSYRLYRRKIWLVLFTISTTTIKDVTPKNRL